MTTDKDKKVTKKPVAKKATSKKATTKAVESKPKRPRRTPTKEVVGAIEKSIPIPKEKPKGKYPLDLLGPEESFLVQCSVKRVKQIRLSLMGAARRITKKTGTEFFVQASPEEGGVRCWRITPEKPIALTDTVEPAEDQGQGQGPELITSPEQPTSFKLDI